ncbi:MAG: hypothetical protein IJV16_06825 [Lachnospiraceae bacterium]|nr:hypothetical protein [Lachnospiraceae bacterium]
MAKQTIVSGDILHASNERVKELEIVIKGSFIATSGSVVIELPYGSIIGLFETPGEKYRFDYEAKEDAMVVSYSYHSEDNVRALIRSNPQITPLITNAVISSVQSLFEKTAQHIEACREMADMLGTGDKLKYDLHAWRNDYFRSITRLLPSKDIGFCTGTVLYAYEYMQDMAPILAALIEKKSEYDLQLMSRGDDEAGNEDMGADEAYTGDEDSGVADDDIENLVGAESGGKGSGSASKRVVDEDMTGAMQKILEYSEIGEEKAETFKQLIADYKALKDRTSTDDGVRRMRRQIADIFVDIYEGAFFRSIVDRDIPLVLKMFFYFGFVDEELAGGENTKALESLASSYEPDPEGNVLTVYEWLKLIFDGKVEPSKNEFDMEYPKYLKQRYDDGEIKQDEMRRLANDRKAKTSFEIHNFMKLGSKITYGRVTTYVPVFTEDSTVRPPEACITTYKAVHDTMNMVRGIDFSCFTRQIVFSNTDIGVTREFIDTEIIPYVILMPNGGTRSALWQEISGAHRNTPGRMMMPIFLDKEVSSHVLRLIAEFRWEMCRREQGVHWNDVTTPSLTSLFCDYLQFYRKNHEISPDLREKIKAQLQSARNSSKAVFVADYMNYVVYESAGSLRLNKVSRDIIFRFCPFTKDIRNKLSVSSPAYQKLIERYDIKLAQKLRLMEIVYTKIEKAGAAVPKEISGQREFLDK